MYELYINGKLVSTYDDYNTASYEAGHIIECGDNSEIVKIDDDNTAVISNVN